MTETRPLIPALQPWLGLLLAAAVTFAGCGPSEVEIERSRQQIQATLETYLPLMADAYRTGDLEPLRAYIAEKEIAILTKNIRDLLNQGRVVDTHLLELTIEDFTLVQYSNAYVTTVEAWHVKVHPAGSDYILGEDPHQVSRVRYQLKRQGDGWLVLSRNSTPLER